MEKTFRYRIYPNKTQTSIIADYNGAINILEEKIKEMLVMK